MGDEIWIWPYPGRSLRQDQLDTCVDLARRHNVSLRYKRYQVFQVLLKTSYLQEGEFYANGSTMASVVG